MLAAYQPESELSSNKLQIFLAILQVRSSFKLTFERVVIAGFLFDKGERLTLIYPFLLLRNSTKVCSTVGEQEILVKPFFTFIHVGHLLYVCKTQFNLRFN